MQSGKMNTVLMFGAALLLTACGGGGDSGTTPPAAVPTAALTVTLASGLNAGAGTVSSNPAGLTCTPNLNPTSCAGSFPLGQVVTLTAVPRASHSFAGWSGAGCAGVGTCVVTMNAVTAVTATFNGPTPTPSLTVSVNGSGTGTVTSNLGGINCPAACLAILNSGDVVTLTGTPTGGSGFQGWTGGGCSGTGSCTITMTANTLVTATFFKPTISMTVTGSGSVSSSPAGINACTSAVPCIAQFNYNSPVTLTATIPGGSAFTGWSFVGVAPAGTCTGTTNPCQINPLTADVTMTAAIAPVVANPTVTVNFANSNRGTGNVTSTGGTTNFTNCSAASCLATYASGTTASITATAAPGSVFAGWTAGPCSGTTTSPCVVNQIVANQTMTAAFTRPRLTLTMVGTGTVSLTGSVTGANTNCTGSCIRDFNSGETVTLTASTLAGFPFLGWTGGLPTCTGGNLGSCSFIIPAGGAVVTATFNSQVSTVQNFKFIAAAGLELLAIDPASPGTPTPVKVGGVNVTLPNFTGGQASDGASMIGSGTYNFATTSFTNIQSDTIIFVSGGRMYKASTLVSNGVPGSLPANEPQQVSNLTTAQSCGVGSVRDFGNASSRIIGFNDAGGDGNCNNGNEFLVLMRLNDGAGTAPVSLPVGTNIDDGEVFNLATGALSKVILVTAAGNLQTIDNTLAAPVNITGGIGRGNVNVVATQSDKVFVASDTSLYIYTPSSNQLSAAVVTADPGQTWVLDQWDASSRGQVMTDSNAIYLVQTNGHVYRVPLATAPGATIAAKHFTAPASTVAWDVKQTPNKIMILTGTVPNGPAGPSACNTGNPTTCNNGLLAVDKTAPNQSVPIEAPAQNKVIWAMAPFNNHITYSLNGGGARARIEDASVPAITVGANGGWMSGTVVNSANITTLAQSAAVNMLLNEWTGPNPNGSLIKVVTSPTATPVTIGTLSDPTNLLQSPPYFQDSDSVALLGFSRFSANPNTTQPFFIDATFNSLTRITTPGQPAEWEEVLGN